LVSLQCEEVTSLVDVARQTDALFLGILGGAREWLDSGEMVNVPLQPAHPLFARFALVTLGGRTELPAMAEFRRFVVERFAALC